ncbi:hypothetical protein B9Z55_023277 [Caenorhabditis nigoni]|uniref:Uncharacterized protein n=1 Tax=Caenorhabditis nigoni TaxID=1611254 RepID=A0A2G5SPG4_9PELO|nr:hypothetical protein B9Z55_023277 [Caenorhabditis nigoni]
MSKLVNIVLSFFCIKGERLETEESEKEQDGMIENAPEIKENEIDSAAPKINQGVMNGITINAINVKQMKEAPLGFTEDVINQLFTLTDVCGEKNSGQIFIQNDIESLHRLVDCLDATNAYHESLANIRMKIRDNQ